MPDASASDVHDEVRQLKELVAAQNERIEVLLHQQAQLEEELEEVRCHPLCVGLVWCVTDLAMGVQTTAGPGEAAGAAPGIRAT